MRKPIGYVLLVLSCLAWALVAALPFFHVSLG